MLRDSLPNNGQKEFSFYGNVLSNCIDDIIFFINFLVVPV